MMYWIVGRLVESAWEFQGLYEHETDAVARCEAASWFVAPVHTNAFVPTDTTPWEGAYYPLAE